jgi:hypothetical protein
MVRFEKSLYEKLLNNKLFGRERIIASPSKTNYIQPATYTMAQAYHMRYKHSYFQKAIAPVVDWFYKIFFWQYTRGELLQRGFVADDYNHTETELRRGILRENILRESCHPYEQLFYRYRRLRYFKVDRIIQGFFVPDFVRKDVEKRTLSDAAVAKYNWDNFVHNNFMSDLTPSTYFGRVASV